MSWKENIPHDFHLLLTIEEREPNARVLVRYETNIPDRMAVSRCNNQSLPGLYRNEEFIFFTGQNDQSCDTLFMRTMNQMSESILNDKHVHQCPST